MSLLPKTRQQLRDFCLRKLGAGVLKINISEEQIEDRISEALAFYTEFHSEGMEHLWLQHQITASEFFVDVALAQPIPSESVVVGQTSGAVATIYDTRDSLMSFRFVTQSGTFEKGEILDITTGDLAGDTIQLSPSEDIFIGDIDKKYIEVPEHIIAITQVLPITRGKEQILFPSLFSLGNGPNSIVAHEYLFDISQFDLITYDIFQKHLALIDFELNPMSAVYFNQVSGKVQLDIDWTDLSLIDSFVIFEAYRTLDPSEYPCIYSDHWLIKYATALLKYQWGWNLSKWKGKELPGGWVWNAEFIISEAKSEIEMLEKDLKEEHQNPPLSEIG
jgi:hypothetical protein